MKKYKVKFIHNGQEFSDTIDGNWSNAWAWIIKTSPVSIVDIERIEIFLEQENVLDILAKDLTLDMLGIEE